MNDAECKLIEQKCVEEVGKALKTLTSGEIYDRKGYLNEVGYNALEEIEGLDLFWICDPLIKLAKQGEWEKPFEMNGKTYHKCNHCHISSELILIDKFCPNCGAAMRKGGKK